jgi:hypothetical protein
MPSDRQSRKGLIVNKPKMTLKEFFAEAGRLGLTADVFVKQLAQRPEFADCVPLNAQQDAPTDADLDALHDDLFPAPTFKFDREPVRKYARALLDRYAPAQDAEQERDAQWTAVARLTMLAAPEPVSNPSAAWRDQYAEWHARAQHVAKQGDSHAASA